MTDGECWLLIDDDESFLQVLSRSLARQGVESATASNRADALRALGEKHFNRCVLDLNLAGESGLQLLPELLQHDDNLLYGCRSHSGQASRSLDVRWAESCSQLLSWP